MGVTFDPETRLTHLENYLKVFHMSLTFEEAKIQLLRSRLIAYKLVAELGDEKRGKCYADDIIKKGYKNLGRHWEMEIEDPYEDPCAGQYKLLTELRSYVYRDMSHPFMIFIRSEFRKIFVPTLRLMTALCQSENKYTWEEVKRELQEVMTELGVEIGWDDCEAYLEDYLEKVSQILNIPENSATS